MKKKLVGIEKMSSEQTLTRSCIRDAMHQKLNLTMEKSSVLLESIIHELYGLILNNPYVKIMSFGTFLLHTKKERLGRNPKTKTEAVISPRKSVSFRPSALLREKVNTVRKRDA